MAGAAGPATAGAPAVTVAAGRGADGVVGDDPQAAVSRAKNDRINVERFIISFTLTFTRVCGRRVAMQKTAVTDEAPRR
jgi:hypothetical protein